MDKEIEKLKKKIEYFGCSMVHPDKYYHVAGVLITVKNERNKKTEYICTCKYHSVKDIDNNHTCIFVRALKSYLGDKDEQV